MLQEYIVTFTHVTSPSVAGVHADHARFLEADTPSALAVRIRGDGNLYSLQSDGDTARTCERKKKNLIRQIYISN
jgi:hypothetical protein